MAVVKTKAVFLVKTERVWELVTSCTEYGWRSDLQKIEVVEFGKKFIEYTKDGYATEFTITVFEPYKRYEFDMENSNMKGHWCGIFSDKGGKTEVEFTETVTAKKLWMRPFVSAYLKKQQKLYLYDLAQGFGRR